MPWRTVRVCCGLLSKRTWTTSALPSWHVLWYVLAGQTLESADCAPVWRGEGRMARTKVDPIVTLDEALTLGGMFACVAVLAAVLLLAY